MSVKLQVQVRPNAKRNEIVSFEEGILRIKIGVPPVKGKANKELVKFLSEILETGKSNIAIEKGATSREKTIAIRNMTQSQLSDRLDNWRQK